MKLSACVEHALESEPGWVRNLQPDDTVIWENVQKREKVTVTHEKVTIISPHATDIFYVEHINTKHLHERITSEGAFSDFLTHEQACNLLFNKLGSMLYCDRYSNCHHCKKESARQTPLRACECRQMAFCDEKCLAESGHVHDIEAVNLRKLFGKDKREKALFATTQEFIRAVHNVSEGDLELVDFETIWDEAKSMVVTISDKNRPTFAATWNKFIRDFVAVLKKRNDPDSNVGATLKLTSQALIRIWKDENFGRSLQRDSVERAWKDYIGALAK
jgi:hypothetical protein